MDLNSNIRNKKTFCSLSLILLLAMTLMMAFAQPGLAQVGVIQPEKTSGYISVAPTLVGVGQQLTVNLWIFPLPTLPNDQPGFYGFKGISVTFTKPDGTKDTMAPTDGTGAYPTGQTQAMGSLYFMYTPTVAGNWSVSFTMPAQNITDTIYIQDLGNVTQYTGCTSNTCYFTVQTDPVLAGLINGYPWAQLPNSNVYWSYPINDNNREWSAISGDWLGSSLTVPTVNNPTQLRWQPYGTGPASAHIVWTNQNREGGIIGGAYGSLDYIGGIVNSGQATGIVVMDGNVYTNVPNSTPVGQPLGQFRCINEATGKVMYQVNGSITYGIHLPGNTYQQSTAVSTAEGGLVTLASSSGSLRLPYLWGTATVNGSIYWNYYDPLTGALIYQLNNCGSARLIDGTVLAYGAQSLTTATDTSLNGYVYCWNMTSVVNSVWNTGIVWKTQMPIPITGGVQTATGIPSTYRGPTIFAISSDNSVIVVGNQYQQYCAFNALTGASLWNLTLNYQTNTNEEIPLGGGVDDFLIWNPSAANLNCYSIKTGALLWTTPSVADSPWATTWTVYYTETNDLNNLYVAYPDGIMRAYSLTDGHLLWSSTAFPSTEYPNNVLPFVCTGTVMVGGNIYTYGGYSTGYQIDPVPRFAMLICINATTGNVEWTLNGGVMPAAAANGYVIGYSQYDGMDYCLGKGQTSTTVTAQQQVGGSVLIQGSVLDQSAAQPNTAAISDANMSVWMDYLHMQNSTLLNNPPNCNGVPITLTAVDPNGNSITIGATTSDYQGNFGFQWTPTSSGLYHIYATFAGSNSYYTSLASTYATVAAVASPTAAPTSGTQPVASNADMIMYFAISVIAIIVAIAVATVLIIRKK